MQSLSSTPTMRSARSSRFLIPLSVVLTLGSGLTVLASSIPSQAAPLRANSGLSRALVPVSKSRFYYTANRSNGSTGRERAMLTLEPDQIAVFRPADELEPEIYDAQGTIIHTL